MGDGKSVFSKSLDLLNDNDIVTCFQELMSSGYPLPVTDQHIFKDLVHFGREFFPDTAFSINPSGLAVDVTVKIPKGVNRSYSFANNILPSMSILFFSKNDIEFLDKVRINLANLPQYDDTIFELTCLYYFSRNGFFFQYEPDICEAGANKKPDFRLKKGDIDLFCECKQLRIGESKSELRFSEQCNYLVQNLGKDFELQLFEKNLRLEVNLITSPSTHALDELVKMLKQISERPEGISELPVQVGEGLEYMIGAQDKPNHFTIKTMGFGSMRLTAGKPRRLGNPETGSPEGEIAIFSRDLAERQSETLRREIRRAKNQLPENKPGVVIINRAKLSVAQQEIQKRMNGTQYDNIIAITTNPFDDFWACYRIPYRELLFALFEGFQPVNPFE